MKATHDIDPQEPPLGQSLSGVSPAEQAAHREGEYWTISFDGRLCRLKHTRGMQHLAVLLGRPGERIAALELTRGAMSGADPGPSDVSAAEPVADRFDGERARVNVTRQISLVLKRLAAYHPALASHLNATIHTGLFCSYTPDPRLPIRWVQSAVGTDGARDGRLDTASGSAPAADSDRPPDMGGTPEALGRPSPETTPK